jgi:hypothetical protein
VTVSSPPPNLVLGRLADERRLRALAAVALGATRVADVAERSGMTDQEAARALAHLLDVGVVRQGAEGLQVDLGTFADAARAASTPRARPALDDATPEQAAVVRNFVDEEGRLRSLPAREARRRLVLEWVAGRFEVDRTYTEREVNGVLLRVHDDVAALRRHLVDERLLERQAGVYRRPSGDASRRFARPPSG